MLQFSLEWRVGSPDSDMKLCANNLEINPWDQ